MADSLYHAGTGCPFDKLLIPNIRQVFVTTRGNCFIDLHESIA